MPGEMKPQPFGELVRRVISELREREELFGVHRSLFYVPSEPPLCQQTLFGCSLDTPFGPAAGPHTQLAQNIVSAWLCGGRFIELKTVQIKDALEIPRPCIDMEDEGYNVEWSQELKLEDSARQYINAWALIHLLPRLLDFPTSEPGTVFNMSVGYDLEGIRSAPLVRFMDRLEDASEELEEMRETLRRIAPHLADVRIPTRVTNNVTISTMHGCPPDQIEAIGRYLLDERGLHTLVKLNPTLLGQDEVMRILHQDLGYRHIRIPETVFSHDLQYDQALELIENLHKIAQRRGLSFGVKLSNTLPTANHREVLPGDELYMSGRALYPITLNLFHRLEEEFHGDLQVSYAAGADAHNAATLIRCGAHTVTAASDLLKPGGYGRLRHWLEELTRKMEAENAATVGEFARGRRDHLAEAAAKARHAKVYRSQYYAGNLPKVDRPLASFDCVIAPCVEHCAIAQDVPQYAWWIAQGEPDKALEVIVGRNPLPGVTGYVCNHLCQTRCTRIGYDEPVLIRALKRFADEKGRVGPLQPAPPVGRRVAIVGAGPAGLSAAYFLALSGVAVTLFERRSAPGGWPAAAPEFRLPSSVVNRDIARIEALGVEFRLQNEVSSHPDQLLAQGYDAVYLACGLQKDALPGLEGEDAQGVWGALELLQRVAQGDPPELGSEVCVVGGGNTAMDAARTAQRLTGRPVTVVYRRTEAEMPADREEIEDLLAEGNRLLTLLSPVRVAVGNGQAVGLECVRNRLGERGADGRRRPIPIEGTEHTLRAETVIFAVGQRPAVLFLSGTTLTVESNGRLRADRTTGRIRAGVYAGGDLVRGPATIVEACSDGRAAAEAICSSWGIPFHSPTAPLPNLGDEDIRKIKLSRTRKHPPHNPERVDPRRRRGFELVEQSLSNQEARREAARCLQCSTLCDKCVEVCPNRANVVYFVRPRQLEAPVLSSNGQELALAGHEPFRVAQQRQILHVHDLCNECGNCATFCVYQGRPYEDKPRLFLDEDYFREQSGPAIHICGHTIEHRSGGEESHLEKHSDTWYYQDKLVQVTLNHDLSTRSFRLKQPFVGKHSLLSALKLAVIYDGVTTSAPYVLSNWKAS